MMTVLHVLMTTMNKAMMMRTIIVMVQDRGEEGRMGVGANGRGVSEALDGATGVSTLIIITKTILIIMTMTILKMTF